MQRKFQINKGLRTKFHASYSTKIWAYCCWWSTPWSGVRHSRNTVSSIKQLYVSEMCHPFNLYVAAYTTNRHLRSRNELQTVHRHRKKRLHQYSESSFIQHNPDWCWELSDRVNKIPMCNTVLSFRVCCLKDCESCIARRAMWSMYSK